MIPIHVLLVEDNEGDIVLINEALQSRPMIKKISITKNGQDAIDFVNKTKGFEAVETPDLILLDINLPRKNGYEVLKAIKDNEKTRMIPVIMLTTSSSPEDINKCYFAFANLYISKPGEVDSLELAVDSIENFWRGMIKLPYRLD